MSIAERDGIRIAYEVQGSGPPLLLIQGLGYARWGWEPVVPLLARSFQVILFDNRGIGGSESPHGPYTTSAMAGDALEVLDEAGVERAHVLGTSLGGMIAQQLALASPDRVDRLALACTTPGGPRAHAMPSRTGRDKVEEVDYKNIAQLRRHVSEKGKIRSRRITGTCRRHQRQVAVAVKRAREMALLPYATT